MRNPKYKPVGLMTDAELLHAHEVNQGSHETSNPRMPGYKRQKDIEREVSRRGLVLRVLSMVVPGRGRHRVSE